MTVEQAPPPPGLVYILGWWREVSTAPLMSAVVLTARPRAQTGVAHIADDAGNVMYGVGVSAATDPEGRALLTLVWVEGAVYDVEFGGVKGTLRCDDWDEGSTVPFTGIRGLPGGDGIADPLTWDAVISGLNGRIAAQVAPVVEDYFTAHPPLDMVIDGAVEDYLTAHPPTGVSHDDTSYAFGIVDRDGRGLPLFRRDGGLAPIPLARAADDLRPLLTPASSDGTPIWGVLDRTGRSLGVLMPDGSLAPVVLAAVRRQLAGPEVPVTEALCIGTSLTAIGVPNSYPDRLAALGVPTLNKGWAGRNSFSIASTWGAIPVPLPAAVTIPAAGSVLLGSLPWEVTLAPRPARLAGVDGTLTVASGSYSFTRSRPGTETSVPAVSPLLITDELPTDRILIVEASRNNPVSQPSHVVIGHLQALINRYARAQRPRVLIMGEPMATTDSAADKAARQARNAALRAAFPASYIDAFEWLLTDAAATAAGVTLTTQDRADIAAGVTPASLRSDTLHLNTAGATAVARYLYDAMTAKGWTI